MARRRESLQRNWPYMLTATLLSILLWVAVSADTVSQQTIPADLLIINNDRRYVLAHSEPAPDAVSVIFTGRAGDLVSLSVQRPQIIISVERVDSLEWEMDLLPEMVRGRGGRELVDVHAVSVRPNRLLLRFQPRAQKVVPVIPQVRFSFADGYAQSDSVRAEPGAVSIEGAEDAVNQIDSVFTVPITRERLREAVALEVPLVEPDVVGPVELSLSSVRILVGVEPRSERVFPGIPVSVRGVGAADVRVEPSLVDVRVVGPRTAVQALRPEALSTWIELAGTRELGRMMAIQADTLGPFLEVVIDPDSARVVRTSAQGG